MKNKIIQKILTAIFFAGLAVILKIYFDTPVIAIIFLLVFAVFAGLIRVLVCGYINPPDWLYRIRFSVLGVGYGIFIGILLFGMEAIEDNTFIVNDLLKFILIGSVIGGIFNSSMIFGKSQKSERRNGLFLSGKQLIKDFALLTNPDGEQINGKLVLTNENLIFLENGTNEKVLEKNIRELNPVINSMKFPGIPNGFKIENGDIIFKVPFPWYWLKRIEKRKQLKTTTYYPQIL